MRESKEIMRYRFLSVNSFLEGNFAFGFAFECEQAFTCAYLLELEVRMEASVGPGGGEEQLPERRVDVEVKRLPQVHPGVTPEVHLIKTTRDNNIQ